MAPKKMTIETLAEMINEGFKTTATKKLWRRYYRSYDQRHDVAQAVHHALAIE
jgi:hypothetical protein